MSAPDQTERVILHAAEEDGAGCPCDVIVVGDSTGELTAAALAWTAEHEQARVWSWNVSCAQTAALAERFAETLTAGRLQLPVAGEAQLLDEFVASADAHLVLMRLPKALAALDDLARRLARGREDLTVIAGGRVKHMTRTQNEVLAASFSGVRASRGIGKSRALIAEGPRPDAPAPQTCAGTARVTVRGAARQIRLHGVGGVFGGARPDAGSLLLIDALERALGEGSVSAERAIDLGSGNGLLTAYLAAAFPNAHVLGSDDDADAVAATRATLAELTVPDAASGRRLTVTWDDALSHDEAASADLVLLNPPFHDGTVVDATLVQGLLDAAARVLRPGGQLWFVHNSHLRYRPEVEARVGPVQQQARDRRFTVLSARKR